MKMPVRLILDTDIGTDVDDCVALALILGSPELSLDGVTCVYGDVELRARMVLKLLSLAGRTDIPVMLGARETLLGKREVYWAGHEGEGLLEPADEALQPSSENAIDFIVRVVMENPGEIHLLAIGPLTNVALALQREPRLFDNLAGLAIMGGVLRSTDRYAEHNILCDPEAAQVVIEHPMRKVLVPLDVTLRVSIRQADVDRIRAAGTPFHEAVARQVELYPYFAKTGATFLHDPLAAALVVEPRLCDFTPVHVDVETEGKYGTGVTFMRPPSESAPVNADVALGVDAGKAERFVVDRLANVTPSSS
jgi:purine nucleosidase